MSFVQIIRARTNDGLRSDGRARVRLLRLEALEDRRLLAFTVNHTPYIQLGNAPLEGYNAGADQAEILWQTTGTQDTDTFTARFRETGTVPWTNASLNAQIITGVGGRINHSATFVGLSFNDDYDYEITHLRGGSPIATYSSAFQTRLNSGDSSNFTFATYGDAAIATGVNGTPDNFILVQNRINLLDPAFSLLLGDNVYNSGTHAEYDLRLDPSKNASLTTYNKDHIDYFGFGNHDVGYNSGQAARENYSMPIPVQGVTSPANLVFDANVQEEENYSYDYGGAHFLTFDTNNWQNNGALDKQLNWAVADINAAKARANPPNWIIVFGHHPITSLGGHTEATPDDYYYEQVLLKLGHGPEGVGVDLLLFGHAHNYQRSYPLTGSTGATATYVLDTDNNYAKGTGLPLVVQGTGGVGLGYGASDATFSGSYLATAMDSNTSVAAQFGFGKVDVTPTTLTYSYLNTLGQTLDSFTIGPDIAPPTAVAVFQDGVGGYAGTLDTYVHEDEPTTNHGSNATVRADGDDDLSTAETQAQEVQGLIRFNNMFLSGGGASRIGGPIPDGATIVSAVLTVHTGGAANDSSPSLFNLQRMIATWDENATWDNMNITPAGVVGVSRDNQEASSTITASAQYQGTGGNLQPNVNVLGGVVRFDVTADLQLWSSNNTLSTRGWLIHPDGVALDGNAVSGQTDGWVFASSEAATIANRPMLVVTYAVPNSSTVTGRRTFYAGSQYETAFGDRASAIATDKVAYIPTGSNTTTEVNVTSYVNGLTGIMVELTGTHGTLTAADFTVKMSEQNLDVLNTVPTAWASAPAFTLSTVPNTPSSGTDRYELVWADGAISNRYLEVIVEGNDALGGSNTNTGLAASDYFFFGNMVGETFNTYVGDGLFVVEPSDELAARNNQGNFADISFIENLYDFNRDLAVDPNDQLIARFNQNFLLFFSTTNPPAAPEGGDGSGSAVASALAASSGGSTSAAAPAAMLLPEDSDNAAAPASARLVEAAFATVSMRGSSVEADSLDVELALDDELLAALLA